MTNTKTKEDSIHKAHNNVFIKTFQDPDNLKILLDMALPEPVKNALDFSEIEIGFTGYVSDDIKDAYSDIVAKTRMKTVEGEEIATDIYILVEHKSTAKNKYLVQVLKYMYLEWQKDVDQGKPLRVIIPMFFYHGKKKWNVPRSFADQFNVNDEIKEFLLNYKYVLFDTRDWNFEYEANEKLKNNVFLLTALALLKSAHNDDMETIESIFRLWYEKGFIKEKNKILFFLRYITEIRFLSFEELKKKLTESKINGGDLMSSLAQQLREEGRMVGIEEGLEKGLEKGLDRGMEKGIEKKAKETAKQMLLDDMPIEKVVKYTGLTEKEVKALMH